MPPSQPIRDLVSSIPADAAALAAQVAPYAFACLVAVLLIGFVTSLIHRSNA